ncbi:MAG: hypothetical protein IJ422_00600 [Oscillospiraceae bacterium]|nr:hypothetical protein [Oscillospiraceae bacterium]
MLHYKLDCLLENLYIRLERLPAYGLNRDEARKEKVTVSLTSFPARIEKAYYAVKSLMLQSYKADRIVLWLAESQFAEKKLPERFRDLTERGLEIRWCEDLRSHKKYYYSLRQQKADELVVTYDDDIIYEEDSLEKLVRKHEQHPDCIICNRGHEIVFDDRGKPAPYKKWTIHSAAGVNEPTRWVVPSTGNGCLYPFGCMPEVAFRWDLIRENALTADDLWMRFCSLSNQVEVVKTKETIAILCEVWGSQRVRLTAINDLAGENQRVVDRLVRLFPNAFED